MLTMLIEFIVIHSSAFYAGIAAADDIIIRPALSRRPFETLPDAAWTVVPGGHAAFWEDPGPWNQAVLEFVHAHR